MISRVSAVTPSRIFAGSTENVPSAFDPERALVEQVVELHRLPSPCASLTPKRIERNADARNVVYIVCSIALSSTPLSTRYCSAHRPEMSALASSMAL